MLLEMSKKVLFLVSNNNKDDAAVVLISSVNQVKNSKFKLMKNRSVC